MKRATERKWFMNIVVLDGYTLNPGDNPWDGIEALGKLTVYDGTDVDEIRTRAADAHVILTNKVPLTAETLAVLPDLGLISVLATGYNIVDVEAARDRNIVVSNVPIYGTDAVAQFVFALLLGLCHHVEHHSAAVKQGRWAASGNFCFWDSALVELVGKTMGIIGMGRIGRRTAQIARAFGMKVIAADIYQPEAPAHEFVWKAIPALCAEADVISLHCPQTDENLGMVDAQLLARMKPTAFLINTSRGGLINEADLARALQQGTLAGAACDVVSQEPISAENPLLEAPNTLLTPHIAWATLAARKRLMNTTIENIRAFHAGAPINRVN
jgi:glycerate dehydrogenase